MKKLLLVFVLMLFAGLFTVPAQAQSNSGSQERSFGLENIRVFPNPVTDYFKVNLVSKAEQTFQIRVFDLTGSEVAAKTCQGQSGKNVETFDTKLWDEGVYLVRVSSKGHTLTQKIIVQHG